MHSKFVYQFKLMQQVLSPKLFQLLLGPKPQKKEASSNETIETKKESLLGQIGWIIFMCIAAAMFIVCEIVKTVAQLIGISFLAILNSNAAKRKLRRYTQFL